jgi:predicted DNA-binding transcriptional regulator AlpA
MSDEPINRELLDVRELSARAGMSPATIWRLKRAGKIPFCQPGGPGCAVRFPADALTSGSATALAAERPLSGPRPMWMQELSQQIKNSQ